MDDGFDDVIVGALRSVGVLMNNGNGTLKAEVASLTTPSPLVERAWPVHLQASTVSDIENDGARQPGFSRSRFDGLRQ